MTALEQSFYISLIDRLRKLPSEAGWYEYKMNNEKPELIGQYISALSNSATLEGKEKGYLIWGISDDIQEIQGTSFRPSKAKIGNEVLENWLVTQTKPRLNIKFVELEIVEVDRIIDTAPHSRNEAMASFLRMIHICEERGSGFDRMEEGMSDLKIPAPKVESADDFVRTKLYWYPSLNCWKKEDKIRTCYLATCYNYVNEIEVSNSILRERFGVEEKNKSMVSRIINDTMEVGMIKLEDVNAVTKMRRYVPYWA